MPSRATSSLHHLRAALLVPALLLASLAVPAGAGASGADTPSQYFSRDSGQAADQTGRTAALSTGSYYGPSLLFAGLGPDGGYVDEATVKPEDGRGAFVDQVVLPGATSTPIVGAGAKTLYAWADAAPGVVHVRAKWPYEFNPAPTTAEINVGGDLPPIPVALLEDPFAGNYLVVRARRTDDGGSERLVVVRLQARFSDETDTQLDPGFGDDGAFHGPWTNDGSQVKAAIWTYNGLIVTGRGSFMGPDGQPTRLHLFSLSEQGVPYTGFGTNGTAVVPVVPGAGDDGPIEEGRAMADVNGQLFVAGSVGDGAQAGFVVNLTEYDGRPFEPYGASGTRRLAGITMPEALTVDYDNAAYVLGSGGGETRLTSLTAQGANSPDYGDDGIVTVGGCGTGARSLALYESSTESGLLLPGLCAGGTLGATSMSDPRHARDVSLYANVESATFDAGQRVTDLDEADAPTTPDAAAADGATIAAAPLRSSPLRSSPLRSSPLRSSPLRSSPLRSSPLRSSPLRSSPLTSIPLRSSPLRSSGWTSVLAGTPLANQPLQTVTLGQVLDLRPAVDVTLGDLDVVDSPLRDAPLATLLLLGRPLSALPAPGGNWCTFLVRSSTTLRCGTTIDLSVNTLLDLALQRVDLTTYLQTPIPLTTGVLGSGDLVAPIAEVTVDAVNLANTGLANLPVSTVADLVDCAPDDPCGTDDTVSDLQAANGTAFGDATVGDLLGVLRSSGRIVTLQDLLPGLVTPDQLPFDKAAFLKKLKERAPISGDGIPISLSYTQACTTESFKIVIDAPGSSIVPGSAAMQGYGEGHEDDRYPLADPDDGTLTLTKFADGAPLASHDCYETGGSTSVFITFELTPPAHLGSFSVNATVQTLHAQRGTVESSDTGRTPALLDIEDQSDPGATKATASPLSPDTLRSEYIPTAGDVDAYKFDAPAPGSVVTLSAVGLPADVDLYVQGPPTTLPVPAGEAARLQSTSAAPIGDGSAEPIADTSSPQPDGQAGPISPASLVTDPLRGSSTHRGTGDESVSFIVGDGDAGKSFLATVAGYGASTSDDPYTLRMSVTPPPAMPQCINRTVTGGTVGTYPASIPATTQTLILFNRQRTEAIYGATATNAMIARLNVLATTAGVNGVVLPVEGAPTLGAAVRSAYSAWDAAPCSVGAANDTVAAINAVVAKASTGLTALRNVVIVGADDVIPQARIPDRTGLANERDEADQITAGGKDTPASRALRTGNVLSDDPYGDFDPQAWLGGTLAVPDVALGRLVETPADVVAQVNRYIGNQVITPTSGRVTGYDFLTDGATSILNSFKTTLGGTAPNATGLINETWTAADARTVFNRAGAGLTSVNAHYDAYRALPAATFNGSSSELVTASQTSPAAGSLLFTIGCHAGLSVVDSYAAGAGVPAAQLLDWAQRTTQTGSLFVGNTGFGYGDRGTIAYSERLMADFAAQVSTKASTVGQALMYAKQRYLATLGAPSVYDGKVVNEATFYGLPMYRITTAGAVGAPALPATIPVDVNGRRESAFSVSPVLAQQTTDRGSFWTADGKAPTVSPLRPIQPRTDTDVTPGDGLEVHGALIEALTSRDVANVNPVNALPTIDQSSREPEPLVAGAAFPSTLAKVDSYSTPTGRKSLLSLAAGQFLAPSGSETGTQRLYTKVSGRVFRSPSTDQDAPRIGTVTGDVASGVAVFTAYTPDADVNGGLVLYLDGTTGIWRSAQLAKGADGVWSGGGAVTSSTTPVPVFFVQLYDAAGNVGASTGKGVGYTAPVAAPVQAGAPKLVPDSTPTAAGYYTGPVELTLDDPAFATSTFAIQVDGGEARAYDGPFKVTGDGSHVVTATSGDGRQAKLVLRIDLAPPVIQIVPDRDPDHRGFYTAPVTLSFRCVDAVSGVKAPGCPAPKKLSGEGNYQAVGSGTISDNAGRTASASAKVSIDLTTPVVTINAIPAGTKTTVVSGTATDVTSGLREVDVTIGGKVYVAALTCNAARTSCTWKVTSPVVGTAVVVKVQGQDLACNADPAKAKSATLKLTK